VPIQGRWENPECMYAARSHGAGGCATERAPISVFLVDDVPELRELIRLGMEEDPGFDVVGEAGDGRSALEGIAKTRPEAVLLDLSMPDMDGFQAIPQIREGDPDIAIIVLSGFSAERMGPPAIDRGADGYIEKGTPIQDLRDATRHAVAKRRGD
jgi:DNA-binding NarL/FixJ family response regulator